MNPDSPVHRARLFKAIKHHHRQLGDAMKLRTELIADYAGSLYGSNTKKQKTALSLMNQAADALMLVLAANAPRFLITPRHSGLRGFARHYQETINRLVIEINLQDTLQAVARDAFFGAGFIKTYLADAPLVEVEQDVWMDPGQPFASRISQEDHVYDTDAKDYRAVSFACDRFEIPVHWLEEDKIRFNPQAVAEILDSRDGREARDTSEREELARGLAHDQSDRWGEGEFEPRIELVDVWLPSYGLVCTWATGPRFEILNTTPLSVQEWEGPEDGPYRMLNLGPVPDNVLPSSPALHVKFLFDLVNSIYRKLNNQARRAKQLLVYRKGSEEDANSVRKEADGGTLGLNDPEAAKILQIGNVDNNLLAMGIHVLQQFDAAAGNLSSRMGLGASAPTATQDKLIQGQVSRHEGATQQRMLHFTSRVGRDLGFLLFTDPVMELDTVDRIRGTDITYTQHWRPDDREGTPDDYDFAVEPYSMAYRSPQERAQGLTNFVLTHAPLLPLMQQQGIGPDWHEYLDMQAELGGEPRLRYLFKAQGLPLDEQGGSGPSHDATQAPHTVRESIRRSEPSGATQQGSDQQLMQRLMSQGNQQTQEAA